MRDQPKRGPGATRSPGPPAIDNYRARRAEQRQAEWAQYKADKTKANGHHRLCTCEACAVEIHERERTLEIESW